MVIDTSALIAILLNESEADQFANAIALDERRLLSAASALETGIVIEARKGPAGGRELDLLLHRARIEIVPLTAAQVDIARGAWRRFGRGNHQAGLNFGDCCAYALSKSSGEPLLFKGQDFALTDIGGAG
jgi:ribonuclease VapC